MTRDIVERLWGEPTWSGLVETAREAADTIAALRAEVAELKARALLDGKAMTETAMSRDKAMTNLRHWRQEVGKLHLRCDLMQARADAAFAAGVEAAAKVAEDNGNTSAYMSATWRQGCRDTATAIRALAAPAKGGE